MAFLILFEHLAVIYWGSELRTLPALFGNADWRIAGLVVSLPQLAGLLCSIALHGLVLLPFVFLLDGPAITEVIPIDVVLIGNEAEESGAGDGAGLKANHSLGDVAEIGGQIAGVGRLQLASGDVEIEIHA